MKVDILPNKTTESSSMPKKPKKSAPGEKTIALNKKAKHDYQIDRRFEAGLVLQGWEVKSLRASRVQLKESYVLLKDGEAWVIGMHISPYENASTHVTQDPTRTRKLLLNARELSELFAATQRKGFTVVPTALYWKKNRIKLEVGLGKGKKQHDKRETEKQRDWSREKQRIMKVNN